jgi:hypothetical protein
LNSQDGGTWREKPPKRTDARAPRENNLLDSLLSQKGDEPLEHRASELRAVLQSQGCFPSEDIELILLRPFTRDRASLQSACFPTSVGHFTCAARWLRRPVCDYVMVSAHLRRK